MLRDKHSIIFSDTANYSFCIYNNYPDFTFKNLLNNIMKELLAYTDITYLSKKNYTNVFNMFIFFSVIVSVSLSISI